MGTFFQRLSAAHGFVDFSVRNESIELFYIWYQKSYKQISLIKVEIRLACLNMLSESEYLAFILPLGGNFVLCYMEFIEQFCPTCSQSKQKNHTINLEFEKNS